LLLNEQNIDVSPVFEEAPTKVQAEKKKKSYMEGKTYMVIMIVITLFYFFDVFVGMFMLYYEFERDGYYKFN